jgi:hypothetical protein
MRLFGPDSGRAGDSRLAQAAAYLRAAARAARRRRSRHASASRGPDVAQRAPPARYDAVDAAERGLLTHTASNQAIQRDPKYSARNTTRLA